MKRLSTKYWLFSIICIILISVSVYAADLYRSDPSSFIKVTEYDAPGYGITNSGSYSYFIPTKTRAEFDSFRTAVSSLSDLSICNVVNGGWSSWSGWSSCSSCSQSRTRTCNNPSKACGGADCSGVASESQSCGLVDGGWSVWSCGACSAACGASSKTCTRTCNNPSPACSGADCSGVASESRSCNDYSACTFSWSISAWDPFTCPECGGTQTRTIGCYRSDGALMRWIGGINDGPCGTAPATSQECEYGATSHSYTSCYGGDVYWFDSCNNVEDIVITCGGSGVADSYCPGESCVCRYVGYWNCDGSWNNGCEINLNSNKLNCGSCGNRCNYNEECTQGVCVFKETYCPFFYSWNGQEYVLETTFIVNVDSINKKTTTYDNVHQLQIFNSPKAVIKEIEPETSHIDMIRIRVTLNNDDIIYLNLIWASRDMNKLLEIDGRELVITQGDEVYVMFEELDSKYKDMVSKIEIEANGYYEIYEGYHHDLVSQMIVPE